MSSHVSDYLQNVTISGRNFYFTSDLCIPFGLIALNISIGMAGLYLKPLSTVKICAGKYKAMSLGHLRNQTFIGKKKSITCLSVISMNCNLKTPLSNSKMPNSCSQKLTGVGDKDIPEMNGALDLNTRVLRKL
uniref:Uncharacterized protein n=1 Tax=Glossina austeni TaxID=7395 RepID=A0A1A9VAW8_GLOAU